MALANIESRKQVRTHEEDTSTGLQKRKNIADLSKTSKQYLQVCLSQQGL